MSIKFKSKASGNVITLGENGNEMLMLFGKHAGERKGIFSADQLPGAFALRNQAVAEDNSRSDLYRMEKPIGANSDIGGVGLYQRASPVPDVVDRTLPEDTEVTWSV